jgi:hypothetical protein
LARGDELGEPAFLASGSACAVDLEGRCVIHGRSLDECRRAFANRGPRGLYNAFTEVQKSRSP